MVVIEHKENVNEYTRNCLFESHIVENDEELCKPQQGTQFWKLSVGELG